MTVKLLDHDLRLGVRGHRGTPDHEERRGEDGLPRLVASSASSNSLLGASELFAAGDALGVSDRVSLIFLAHEARLGERSTPDHEERRGDAGLPCFVPSWTSFDSLLGSLALWNSNGVNKSSHVEIRESAGLHDLSDTVRLSLQVDDGDVVLHDALGWSP